MSTLERAIAIAAEAHEGKPTRLDSPTYFIPCAMLSLGSREERIVAVLHDVVEDCPGWTLDRLRMEGFSEEILAALDCVTKREDEHYDTFVVRAAQNPTARQVKLADLHDNCDLSRIAQPTQRDHERIEKYQRAISFLMNEAR